MTQFRQRKFGVRTSFDFGAEGFQYSIGDMASTRSMAVNYDVLNLRGRNDFEIANNVYLSRFVLFPVLLFYGFVALGNGVPFIDEWRVPLIAAGLVIVLIVFAAMALEWTAVTFTEIPTFGINPDGSRPAIRIIQDGDHDRILAALSDHWRERMRALHLHRDAMSDTGMEEKRLSALLDHEIISADEYRSLLGILHAGSKQGPTH